MYNAGQIILMQAMALVSYINYYPLNGEGNGTGAAVGAVLQRRVKAGD